MVGLLSILAVVCALAFVVALVLLVMRTVKKKTRRPFVVMAAASCALFLVLCVAVSSIYEPSEKPAPVPSMSEPVNASPQPSEESEIQSQKEPESMGQSVPVELQTLPVEPPVPTESEPLTETGNPEQPSVLNEPFPVPSEVPTQAESATPEKYDTLQQLYLDVSPEMGYSEMLELVKSTGLPFSEEKYNGSRTVQVAFTEGCTAQRYKKEDGDYLEIHYDYPKTENSKNDELEKYYFSTCVYVPSDSWLSLVCHHSGYYFSIHEPGNYIMRLGSALDLDETMTREDQLEYYLKNSEELSK